LLELEGIAANCIEFGSANDETIFIVVLLSQRNVTVCGSPTVEVPHYTSSSFDLLLFSRIITVNGAVEFPAPDRTL